MKTEMDDDTMDWPRQVSALADGQLQDEALDECLAVLARDAQAREAWQTYHLIGDVLRRPDLAAATPAGEFMARLSRRLADEPPLARGAGDLHPVAPATVTAVAAVNPPMGASRAEAANAPVFRWRFAAGIASVALVAVATALLAVRWSGGSGPVLATAPASGMVVTGSANGPMLRDPQLDEFLQAHRQLGADAVLQAPAGGLHHATFAPPAR